MNDLGICIVALSVAGVFLVAAIVCLVQMLRTTVKLEKELKEKNEAERKTLQDRQIVQ